MDTELARFLATVAAIEAAVSELLRHFTPAKTADLIRELADRVEAESFPPAGEH